VLPGSLGLLLQTNAIVEFQTRNHLAAQNLQQGQVFLRKLARLRGQYLRDKLSPLPSVRAVRGLGLLLGVEVAGTEAKAVAAKCMQQGLVVNAVTDSALRLAPSLLVSEAEIDEAVEILGRVLEAASP